jgi:hypothetical protein
VSDLVTIDLEGPIGFRDPTGAMLAAYGVGIVLRGHQARLTFRVAPDDYARIQDHALFEVRGGPEIPFDAELPFEIEAQLRDDVVQTLLTQSDPAQTLVTALAEGSMPTESWLALSVVQPIEEGVSSGFRI